MSNPWFKFFPSDWLAGTSGMTPAERGVYITLVCLIYEMEGPIVHDAGRLARRCGCNKASFNRALDALVQDGKLSVVDGKITNERAEKELSDRAIRSQKASITASKRWSAQGEKSEQKQRPENANASAKQCVGNAIPEARSQSIEDTNVSLVQSPFSKQDFQDFWDAYPHRNGKKKRADAERAFSKAIKSGVTVRQIADGVANMRRDPDVQRGYARDPTTWLNQKGWTDEFDINPQFTQIRGGQHGQPTDSDNRVRSIITAAAEGTSRQDWG